VINDILDFSKIEAGKLELDPIPFSLRDCLGDAVKTLALRAYEKRVELACDIPPGVPDGLVGDSLRLRQIVLNLMGNSLKFTERGEVVLRVEVRTPNIEHPTSNVQRPTPEAAAERSTLDVGRSMLDVSVPSVELHVSVRDTGIGIPKEKQDRIFQ